MSTNFTIPECKFPRKISFRMKTMFGWSLLPLLCKEFMFYDIYVYLRILMSNTIYMVVSFNNGAGTTNPSGAHGITPDFSGVRVTHLKFPV